MNGAFRVFLACLVGLASCGSPSQGALPQELANGSFEAELSGWESEGFLSVEVGAEAFEGTHVAFLDPDADPESANGGRVGRLRTRVRLEPNRRHRLSFAYQCGFDLGRCELAVTMNGESPYDVIGFLAIRNPGGDPEGPRHGNWRRIELDFFPESNVTELQIGPLSRYRNHLGWGPVWIDDFRIEPLASERTIGRDLIARPTLPSEARVNAAQTLAVLLTQTLLQESYSQRFDPRPVPWSGSLSVEVSDPRASAPSKIDFQASSREEVTVRFRTPGIQRVTLRDESGYVVHSNPVRVTEAQPELRHYWGDLHIHTEIGHADWMGGTGIDGYRFARDVTDLDFAALSEHYPPYVADHWRDELAAPGVDFHEPSRFVTLFGVETGTYEGHHNYYLKSSDPLDLFNRHNPFPNKRSMMRNLEQRKVPFLTIPHHPMLLDPAEWRFPDHHSQRLIELYSNHGSSEEAGSWWRHPTHYGNDYSVHSGVPGHDFRTALDRGHRLGVIACSDTHAARPGLHGLTCIVATELTRESVFDALYARRCYGTTGPRMLLSLQVAGFEFGQSGFVTPGSPLRAQATAHGTTELKRFELIRDGEVVFAAEDPGETSTWDVDLGPYDGQPTYVYARVTQADEHRGWTSPVWIDPAQVANLTIEPSDLRYDFEAQTLAIRPRNTGDRPTRGRLRVYSSADAFVLGRTEEPQEDGLVLYLRAEPQGSDRVRVRGAFVASLPLKPAVDLSGVLELVDVEAHRVVADPRAIFSAAEGVTLPWSTRIGVGDHGHESSAGGVTDFEIEVHAKPSSEMRFRARAGDSPLARTYLGNTLQPFAEEIVVQLGELVAVEPVLDVEISIEPGIDRELCYPLPANATYVVALDMTGYGEEVELDDNVCTLHVPTTEPPYSHWK